MTRENRGRVRRIEGQTGARVLGPPCPYCAGTGMRDVARERAVGDRALAELREMLDKVADTRRKTELRLANGNGNGRNGGPP
jgi:hypothetical protein